MARLTERNGSQSDAIESYRKILIADPTHVGANHRLGVLSTKRGEIEMALRYFQTAVDQGEPSADLLADWGYASFLAGDLDQAEFQLTHALNKDPENKRILNNLGLVIGSRGNLQQSLELFRSAGSEAEALANLAYVQANQGQFEQAKSNYHRSLDTDPQLDVAAKGLIQVHQKLEQLASTTPSNKPQQRVAAGPVELGTGVTEPTPPLTETFNSHSAVVEPEMIEQDDLVADAKIRLVAHAEDVPVTESKQGSNEIKLSGVFQPRSFSSFKRPNTSNFTNVVGKPRQPNLQRAVSSRRKQLVRIQHYPPAPAIGQ